MAHIHCPQTSPPVASRHASCGLNPHLHCPHTSPPVASRHAHCGLMPCVRCPRLLWLHAMHPLPLPPVASCHAHCGLTPHPLWPHAMRPLGLLWAGCARYHLQQRWAPLCEHRLRQECARVGHGDRQGARPLCFECVRVCARVCASQSLKQARRVVPLAHSHSLCALNGIWHWGSPGLAAASCGQTA